MTEECVCFGLFIQGTHGLPSVHVASSDTVVSNNFPWMWTEERDVKVHVDRWSDYCLRVHAKYIYLLIVSNICICE